MAPLWPFLLDVVVEKKKETRSEEGHGPINPKLLVAPLWLFLLDVVVEERKKRKSVSKEGHGLIDPSLSASGRSVAFSAQRCRISTRN